MKNNVIQKKNGIVVVGAIFVDIKGFPQDIYVPDVMGEMQDILSIFMVV